jgi:hypothetical protein
MFGFSIPSDFADIVPELTNLDISSVFAVIFLARSLDILSKEWLVSLKQIR